MSSIAAAAAAQTPSLNDIFDAACAKLALGLRVCMPAKVVRAHGQQRVDVQPLLKQKVRNFVFDYQVVPGALVCMPLGTDYGITYKLQAGDTGVLLCADRSLDSYAASDGTAPVDPADPRCHQLTDAIFLPGLVPSGKQSATTDDMVLRNGDATLHLQKGGTFTFSNTQNEMMALLVRMSGQLKTLADNIAQAQVLTPLGPSPFLSSSVLLFQQVSATMLDVTNRLTTLKGS